MDVSGYAYHCVAGETFDSVALEVFGDERYAAELLCANPALCEKTVFTGGEALKLPVLTIADEDDEESYPSSTAPWKEES